MGRRWLCFPPLDGHGDAVAGIHKLFWQICGGIVETFGAPTTWWSNQNEVLTTDAQGVQVADALTDYAWIWEDVPPSSKLVRRVAAGDEWPEESWG